MTMRYILQDQKCPEFYLLIFFNWTTRANMVRCIFITYCYQRL